MVIGQVVLVVALPDELPAELADDRFRRRRRLLLADLEVDLSPMDPLPEDGVEGLRAEAALDQHHAVVDGVDVLLVLTPENKRIRSCLSSPQYA